MKLSNSRKWGLGVAVALVLGAVACQSTLSLEADGSIMGQSVDVKITYDGRDVKAEKLPANKRADVKFFDAQGKPLEPGATGVGQGEKVPVPRGASYCEVSGASSATSCTGCTTHGGAGGGGGGMLDADEHLCAQDARADRDATTAGAASKWVHVFTLDPDIDGSSAWANVAASFTLQGEPSAGEIHQKLEPLLRGGYGTPVPPGVGVDTFVRMFGEALGGRMFVADVTAGFSSLTMNWNGNPYAALGGGNARAFPAPNGWQVVEVFVSLGDFQVTPAGGSSNAIDLLWSTAEDAKPNRLTQGFTYH